MEIIFDKLFAVDLHHYYYESACAENLLVLPTHECQKKLGDYGLHFRTTRRGFTVFYEVIRGDEQRPYPLRPIETDEKFTFMLTAKDPYLLNMSDLPLDLTADHIFYFTNLKANIQESRLLISADTTHGYVSNDDAIGLRPLSFEYRYQTLADQVVFTATDEWAHTLFTINKEVINGHAACLIDLTPFGPGKYALSINGVEAERFYAGNKMVFQKNAFAVIDLYRHPSVPTTYRFTDHGNNDSTPKTYTIMINNRKTFWKYFFVHKHRLTQMEPSQWPQTWPDDWPDNLPEDWPEEWPRDWPKDWAVLFPRDSEIEILPKPSEMKLMPNGAMAIPFVSNKAIPLRQTAVKGIRLSNQGSNGNASGLREIENLANPSIKTIVPDILDNHVYSEIYVYL